MPEHEDHNQVPDSTSDAVAEPPLEEAAQPEVVESAAPESQAAPQPLLLEAPAVPEVPSSPPHPRSLKRRLEQQQVEERKSRVRSQPLNQPKPKRVREPVVLDWEPEPMTGPWRAKPFVVGLAIVMWMVALALLMTAPDRSQTDGFSRLLVPLIWAVAAATTFVPVQLRLALPGIGWQSMVGFGLLGYILAFVPAPSGWLLDLPDLPVYLLLFLAIFYAVSAAIVPLIYLLGQRYYKLRIHRLDVGRARRQAYEIGLLIVVSLVMAGLRVLSPVTFGLLALVIVLTEALLLSQVQPEG